MADVTGDELTIRYKRQGRGGKVTLSAGLPDGTSYTDTIDIGRAAERQQYLDDLCRARNGIDCKDAAAELERVTVEVLGLGDKDEGGGKRSQADLLVELAHAAEGTELFHGPGGGDAEVYATVRSGDHRETLPIRFGAFRRWLSRAYYEEHGKAPGSQALQDALAVLAGQATHDGPEHPVAVRLAVHGNDIWLDLTNSAWQCVRITSDGWTVTSDPPVKFVRKRGMLALPCPVRGGSLEELRPLVNLPEGNDAWILLVSWLVAALRPGRPFPILAVNGEQGSAKSSLCRTLRALIDPNEAPLRRPPRDPRDLMIAASNAWLIAYDNLSGLSDDLSDCLCCLATGGGLSVRELYSDGDEKLFSATRPLLINGIEDLLSRPDLQDRAISLTLPGIDEDARQDEEDLDRAFAESHPRILGALLNAASVAVRNRPHVKLDRKPRMADFAVWSGAAAPALGWEATAFIDAYTRNRGDATAQVLDASTVGPVVVRLMDRENEWEGTARDLLALLNTIADEGTRRGKEWPGTPRKLGGDLRRIAPALRAAGISADFDRREPGGRRRRLIHLERGCNQPSQPSRDDATTETETSCGGPVSDQPRDGGDGMSQERAHSDQSNRPATTHDTDSTCGNGSPDRDGRDGMLQDHSNDDEEVCEWRD